MREWLFAYGTLLNAKLQRQMFLGCLPHIGATLHGWQIRLGQDGYRFICPANKMWVEGGLLRLNQAQLRRADLWEEVPKYRRERVRVQTGKRRFQTAWVYTRRDGKGRKPLGDEMSHRNPKALHAAIKAFCRPVKDTKKAARGNPRRLFQN
ncbi:gamma-glutamylcyclotransferase family protein [Alteromonas aestuariivivens]|nr:gamma-glutamylcyclotransferase family protein [Alteromonas aestuariivivens]